MGRKAGCSRVLGQTSICGLGETDVEGCSTTTVIAKEKLRSAGLWGQLLIAPF